MAIVGTYWRKGGRFWEANTPLFTALLRNTILALGTFGIAFLYIASGRFTFGPLGNITVPCCLVVLGSMTLVGKKVLTITAFDYYFMGFIFLAFVSHIFANEFLFRQLGMGDLQTNLTYILEMALVYRAYFSLTLLAPRVASRFFVGSSLMILGMVSVVGILQRFGPGKAAAVNFGRQLSVNGGQVLLAAQNERPSAFFTNPNILGYAACVFAAFVVAWGLYNIENITMKKTAAVIALLGLALLCTIACQSRQSMAVMVFAPIVFGAVLKWKARDARTFLLLAALMSIAVFGLVIAVSTSKSTYLTSISKTGLHGDQSYEARTHEIGVLESLAADIAPAGLGQSMSNENQFMSATEHALYNPTVIDSEWGNMFQGFGVWGPVLLALFYLFTAQSIKDVWKVTTPEARLIALAGLCLLLFNLVLTVTAVRVSKYESAGFTFELLGVLAAWRLVGMEQGEIPIAGRKTFRKPATS